MSFLNVCLELRDFPLVFTSTPVVHALQSLYGPSNIAMHPREWQVAIAASLMLVELSSTPEHSPNKHLSRSPKGQDYFMLASIHRIIFNPHQRCGYSHSPFAKVYFFLYCRVQKWF